MDIKPSNIKTIIANWKMNGNLSLCHSLFQELFRYNTSETSTNPQTIKIVVCPPFILLSEMKKIIASYNESACVSGYKILLGAQNCHYEDDGAYTGEISARMLSDLGCTYVIIGHSERRIKFHENNQSILRKFRKIYQYGMIPVLCIGETSSNTDISVTRRYLSKQLSGLKSLADEYKCELIIAYEPIWSIGSGNVADLQTITNTHSFIKEKIGSNSSIMYGGSVNMSNAIEISQLHNVDGLLIGGAALRPIEFANICNNLKNAIQVSSTNK